MQSNELMLEVCDVGKVWNGRVGKLVALERASFCVAPGEFICLLGPSGCGKSTLLEIMAGLVEPTTGEVVMTGRPVREASPDRGMVFQSHALFPWRTVRENVEFGLEMRSVDHSERKRIATQLIDLVGLTGFEDSLPRELSGGMCQRVAVARALANRPRVLLADEPTGQLDSETGRSIMGVLQAVAHSEGVTTVVATHDPMMLELADRVLELRDGVLGPATA
jgi:NitT/TauT family transport system ATP-binding protein